MLTPKDESIDNWFFFFLIGIFFDRYLLDTSYYFYALNVRIAFGKQDDLT
jgi:hypothetical protein